MKPILVTGASGFIGRVVLQTARDRGLMALAGVRDATAHANFASARSIGDLSTTTDFSAALQSCSAVIHCAARAHVLKESAEDPKAEFRRVNVEATVRLAEQAATQGVKRFVFVSSIGVNGAESTSPISAEDAPAPVEPYARSKLAAEEALRRISDSSNMDLVIVRPVLVYGPGCKGNFARLLKLVALRVPLPFGSINGTRSLISVWNLADLLLACVETPEAAGQTLLAADGEDISLPNLLRILGDGMKRPVRLIHVRPAALRSFATLIRQRPVYDKLVGSLQVDISNTVARMQWRPPVSLATGLRLTAEDYARTV